MFTRYHCIFKFDRSTDKLLAYDDIFIQNDKCMPLKAIYCMYKFNERYLKIENHASLSPHRLFIESKFISNVPCMNKRQISLNSAICEKKKYKKSSLFITEQTNYTYLFVKWIYVSICFSKVSLLLMCSCDHFSRKLL